MTKKPDTIVGRAVYYPGPHDLMVFDGKGPARRVSDTVYIAELPPGKWRMSMFRGNVVIADETGQNPPQMWDGKEWHVLKLDEAPQIIALTDEEKSEMYYYGNGCHSYLYGDPETNGGDHGDD